VTGVAILLLFKFKQFKFLLPCSSKNVDSSLVHMFSALFFYVFIVGWTCCLMGTLEEFQMHLTILYSLFKLVCPVSSHLFFFDYSLSSSFLAVRKNFRFISFQNFGDKNQKKPNFNETYLQLLDSRLHLAILVFDSATPTKVCDGPSNKHVHFHISRLITCFSLESHHRDHRQLRRFGGQCPIPLRFRWPCCVISLHSFRLAVNTN
jgi:hypothetical protein